MNPPPEVVSLLQDQAYAALCRESLTEALDEIGREKQQIMSTRPPFGVLGSSQTRETFKTSLRAAMDNEVGLRNRLDQLGQIDTWLKISIEKALQAYLPSLSAEYRCCLDAEKVVTKWESSLTSLHEMSQALARDAHAVAAALNPVPLPNAPPPPASYIEQTRLRALGNLRITVSALQAGLAEVAEVRQEFTQLCDAGADGLQLPAPPAFRDVGWVDKVAALGPSQATAESVRCEMEARTFCTDGLKALLRQALEVRAACLEAGQLILAQCWRELLAHARQHFVQERDVDEVIAELSQHRMAAEINRRQTTFEAANVATLR
jgi:hypothetical protein